MICIGGPSGSGKTTVTHNLIKMLQKAGQKQFSLVRIDRYYRNFSNISPAKRAKINFDHPSSIDFELLQKNVGALLQGKSVQEPEYDFKKHKRTSQLSTLEPSNVIIAEGIFALYDQFLIENMDLGLYVDTDLDICLLRRIVRDMKERGRSLESILEQYQNMTKPMYHEIIYPTIKNANLIVPEGGQNNKAVKVLFTSISAMLKL